MDIGSIFSKIVFKYKVIGKNKDRAVRKGCFYFASEVLQLGRSFLDSLISVKEPQGEAERGTAMCSISVIPEKDMIRAKVRRANSLNPSC